MAGNGAHGFGGDGGPAVDAQIELPTGLAADSSANLFIADTNNQRVRRVDADTKVITTVAGTGVAGFGGDGTPATEAQLNEPHGLAVDPSDSLFIADTANHRIRR